MEKYTHIDCEVNDIKKGPYLTKFWNTKPAGFNILTMQRNRLLKLQVTRKVLSSGTQRLWLPINYASSNPRRQHSSWQLLWEPQIIYSLLLIHWGCFPDNVNNGKCTEHSEVGDHTTVKMVGQVGETAHTSHWACTGASTLITDKALILLVAQNKPPNYQNSHNKSHLYLKKHGSMN